MSEKRKLTRKGAKSPNPARSLTATLALAFVALGVAVLLITGGMGIYFHYQAQRDVIASRQRLIAYEAASKVANFIQDKFILMEGIAKSGALASDSSKAEPRVLSMLLGLEPAFRHLLFFEPGQREMAFASRMSKAAIRDFRNRIINDSTGMQQENRYISPVFIDPLSSEPMVIIAVPVTDVFGDLKGTLFAQINLKFMWDLVDRLKVGETGLAYVVDRNGNLIAFGDTERVLLGENVGRLPTVAEFMNNLPAADEAGAEISTGIDGDAVVGAYVPLGAPDWAVVTELPVAEAYREVIYSALLSVGAILIIAILAGFAGVQVARRLARPIVELTETASRISRGETGLYAQVGGPDEIAVLAEAFNDMTRQLMNMLAEEEARAHELHQEVLRRQEVETALRENEERLDFALSAANEGIWDWDLDSSKVLFDARYYMMAGYEPDEFPGGFEEWEKRVHPDDIGPAQEAIAEYLEGKKTSYDVEFRFLRKDGGYMWVRGQGKIAARDEQGSPTRFVGTHTDITERKELERNLRIYKFVFDNAAIGIYWVDSKAKILGTNEKAAQALGYTKEDLIGLSVWDFDPNVNREVWDTLFQRLLTYKADHFEVVHRAKDGREYPVEITSQLLEYEGEEFTIAFSQDISDRKQAEEELRRLRNYLANIINSMPSVLVGVDTEGRVTQWNKQAELATGLSFGQVDSKPLDTALPHLTSQMVHVKTAILDVDAKEVVHTESSVETGDYHRHHLCLGGPYEQPPSECQNHIP